MKNCGIDVGSIVISTAGRDKGNYFIVVKSDENFVYVVDGDIRKIENPKKKKRKHVELTIYQCDSIEERLRKNNKITNQDMKKALKEVLR